MLFRFVSEEQLLLPEQGKPQPKGSPCGRPIRQHVQAYPATAATGMQQTEPGATLPPGRPPSSAIESSAACTSGTERTEHDGRKHEDERSEGSF